MFPGESVDYEYDAARLRARYRSTPHQYGTKKVPDTDIRRAVDTRQLNNYCRVLGLNPHLLTDESVKRMSSNLAASFLSLMQVLIERKQEFGILMRIQAILRRPMLGSS